jgi:predicted ArsR family transcriptional regulator
MKKEVDNSSPFERESETHEKIHSHLKAHPRGLTTQEIEQQTNISRKAVEKHLQMLLFSNDIYMKQVGSARIYYPNHRYHHLDFQYFDIGKKRFYIDLIENDYGKSILVQQKIKEADKWITKGSVFIPLEAGEEFLKKLKGVLSSKKLKMGAEKNGK